MPPVRPSAINARNVAIVVFDEVEVLDFAGPFEVFSVAGAELPRAPLPPFFAHTVGLAAGPIVAHGGLTVTPRYTFRDCPPPDVLIVPGGVGARRLLTHGEFLAWLAAQAQCVEIVASVCTGALALAAAGLLAGKRATTHHTAFDLLAQIEPGASVVRDARWVQDGHVWTSGGISAGIDMSLAIVRHLVGSDAPVVAEMEWMWHAGTDPAPIRESRCPPSDLKAHRDALLAQCPPAVPRLSAAEAAALPVHVEHLGTVGPMVLIVHGGVQGRLGGGPGTFSAQRVLVERGWRLALVDRPGFGQSPSHGVDDMEADAVWIADLLDGGMHIVGHSWGASGALLAAARRPAGVRSMTLVEPALHTLLMGAPEVLGDPSTAADATEAAGVLMNATTPADYAHRFVASLAGRSAAGEPPTGAAAAMAADPQLATDLGCALLHARMAPAEAVHAAAAVVAEAGIPVLVVTGGWSRTFDAIGAIVARLTGGRHTVVDAPNHFVQRASPEAFNRVVEAFMRAADGESARGTE